MGDLVNLRRLRKIKARAAAEAEASANRAVHGRSKADKKLSKAEQEIAARKLDGHKYDERKHTERQQREPTSDDE